MASTPSTYKVVSPSSNILEFPMVSSLIDSNIKWWRADLLSAAFLPFEADTIRKIPLSHNLLENKLIWIGNKKGEFIVKSVYHITYNLIETKEEGECSSGDPNAQLWKKIWCLYLLAKVKIFGWRDCVNGLPTMENIAIRVLSAKTTLSAFNMPYWIVSLPNWSGIIGKTPHWSLTIADDPS